jgi:streptogramin lyase
MGKFATLGPGIAGIFGLAFLPGGDLIVSDGFAGAIRRIDGVSGQELVPFAPPGTISGPFDMAIGPDGLLYVCSSGLGVQRFDPLTGASMGAFISGGMGPGRSPFSPDWHTVPAPGVLAMFAFAAACRRR